MRSKNNSYLVGLDHLRALAALLIVFYHGLHLISLAPRAPRGDLSSVWWFSKNPFIALVEEGHTAVALFFVMSGFVFSVGALGKEIDYPAYLKNRLLRIYPLLVAVMFVSVTAQPTRYSFLGFLQTLLFQADAQGQLTITEFTGTLWSVSVEFQFYLLFPFLHRFIEREGKRWAFALIALCIAMRVLATLGGGASARDISYWHLPGRLDQFVIGMLSARAYHYLKAFKVPWGFVSTCAVEFVLILMIAFNQLGGWTTSPFWKVLWPTVEGGAWALLVVSYTQFAERVPQAISRPLSAIGTISYSIYLLHFPCIHILSRVITTKFADEPNLNSQLYTLLVVLPILLALAALTYYTIERPFLRMRVHYLVEPLLLGSRADTELVKTDRQFVQRFDVQREPDVVHGAVDAGRDAGAATPAVPDTSARTAADDVHAEPRSRKQRAARARR